jgi:murein DD-endopeptidase MepM/ murein hydrolase activator NlpD
MHKDVVRQVMSVGLFICIGFISGETNGQLDGLHGVYDDSPWQMAMQVKQPLKNNLTSSPENTSKSAIDTEENASLLLQLAHALTGSKDKNTMESGYLGYTIELKGGYGVHHGIDFKSPVGATVYALRGGDVIGKIEGNAASSVVMVKDACTGLIWSYGHINHDNINQGQTILAGQPLGTILDPMAAGETWPPHVHVSTLKVMPGSSMAIGWGRAYGGTEQKAIDNAKKYTINPAQAYASACTMQ